MNTDGLFSRFPTLETDRLILRELTVSDYKAVFDIFRHSEVTRFYDQETFKGLEPAKNFVDSCIKRFYDRLGIRWGLVHKADMKLIGTCGLHKLVDKFSRAEIGYDLALDYWRRGLMSEAIKVILDHCFREVGFNRIEALCMTGNSSSICLLEKLKFRPEGTLRQYGY